MTPPHQADDWIALSDRGILDASLTQSGLLEAGLLVIELALPLQDSAVLIDHQADDGWARTCLLYTSRCV